MTALAPRTTRIVGLVGACALALVALTGCIKVDADVAVNPDATGTGTFAFELQKDAAGFLGISDLASFEAQLTEGDLAGETGLGIFDSCETSESDTGFVYSCSFTNTAFTDPADGPWTIAKDGDSIVFTMDSEGQADPAATGEDELLGDASLGSVTVDVTFPGAITSITGEGATKTSDTTATVSGSLTENISAVITSEAGSSGLSLSVLLVLLVAAAVLILIIVVVVVLISRRGKGGSADAGDGADDGVGAAAVVVPAAAAAAVPAVVEETVVQEAVVEDAPVVEEVAVIETPEPPTAPAAETPESPVTPETPESPESPEEGTPAS